MAYSNAGMNPYQQGFVGAPANFNGGPTYIYAPTNIQIDWGGFGGFGNMNGYSRRPAFPPSQPRSSFDISSMMQSLLGLLSQYQQPQQTRYTQYTNYVSTPPINMTPPVVRFIPPPPIKMTPPRAVAVPLPPPINMTPAVPLPPPILPTPIAVAVPVTDAGEPPGPAGESISVDYLDILVQALDVNHDGRLTKGEFNPNLSRAQLKQMSMAALNYENQTTSFTTLSEGWVNSLVEAKNFVNAHQDLFFRPTPMGAMLTPEMQAQRALNAGFSQADVEQFARWDGRPSELSATADIPQQQAFWNSQPPPP